MLLVDLTTRDFDDKDYGVDKIQQLSAHFEEPLQVHGYSSDKAIYEFRHLTK